ncbi:MAG: hypothetical protein J0I47_01510 [Sphingomonas sp.]|uniref:hypothetical protein n=1 Tax=Sphingomonas sp. TaxID=28214 RepID=UPI001AC982D6|nr:hypothetical protein [Sphingomonas sp.]MBN8806906.1 hypothetical protein [Sphingomonas sp.]
MAHSDLHMVTAGRSNAFDTLAPHPLELVALFALVVLNWAFWIAGGYMFVDFGAPVAMAVIMGVANWRMARVMPETIWTPLFALRLATLVVIGIGGLLPYIVRDATRDYLLSLYPFTPEEAAKTNLIWSTGTFLIIASAFGTNLAARKAFTRRPRVSAIGQHTLGIGLIFLAAGLANIILVDIANLLGLWHVTIAGSVRTVLDATNLVGMFLVALWAIKRGTYGALLIAALVLINVVLGLIALNKTMVLLPMLFIGIALLVDRFSIVRAVLITIALLGSLALLQPMVANARILQTQKYGDTEGGTLSERIADYIDYTKGIHSEGTRTGSDEALVRLSYVNVAAFEIYQYDRRMPDNSIANAAIALVPRFIWPDKPIVTQSGNDLYYALTGFEGSAVSGTVIADAYWNMGYVGLLLICPLIGIYAMLVSRISYGVVRQRDWFMMPFVLIAFKIGFSVDGSFVNSVLAPMVISIIAYPILRLLEIVLSSRMAESKTAALA